MFDDKPIIMQVNSKELVSEVNTPRGVVKVYRLTGIDRQGRAWAFNRTLTILPKGGSFSAPHDFRPLTNE